MATKTLSAVRPNAGVRAWYQKQIDGLIDEMQRSVLYWVQAAYRANEPLIAQDASPVKGMRKRLRDIASSWQKRWDAAAPKIAELYVRNAFKASDASMLAALRAAGIAVKFQITPEMRDALEASLTENVGLIKSIPTDYFQQLEGIVMRSYTAGRDLRTMVSDIKKLYPVAQNRAVLIARDQSNKANAVITRTRQLQLGITEAIWMHSTGGKTPRPGHVAANNKRYEIAKGMLIDGEYIHPGEKINCRCVSRAVLPGL